MKKAERTTRYIIQKVAPIFNRKGVFATSLADLTTATGLTKGSIYGNFQNKDDLASACFQYNLKFLQKGLYHAITLNGDTKAKLLDLIDFYRSHYEELAQQGGCPLMNAAIEADDGYPLLKSAVRDTFEKWRRELINMLATSQDKGELSQELDPEKFANSFIAMIEGGIVLAKSLDETSHFFSVMDTLEEMVNNLT
jgi:TetR/AcrR family transcriptional repressor of nem operon